MSERDDSPGGWDFFVSYTQVDRAWAEWIAWVLRKTATGCWCRRGILCRGPTGSRDAGRDPGRGPHYRGAVREYLESVYGGAEWQAAWAVDPEGTGRKLLTSGWECDRPGLLAGVVGVDLFGLAEAAAKARLRRMVADAIAGRAKPERRRVSRCGPGDAAAGHGSRVRCREVWKVPARNPNFTGRGPDWRSGKALAGGATVAVHSVHGMGGVGKTQLATEYAYAHASDYDLVWWVAAEEPALIPDQFAALAARLDLDPAADPEALRVLVHDRLRSVAGWLLIFDNADGADRYPAVAARRAAAAGVPGHVIVTTRRGGFAALGPVLDLDVIGLPDAVRLLRARVPDLDQDTGEQIAEELGRLPLALEQAAAYLDRSQMPGGEYLELLRSRGAELYARGKVSSRKDTIATLWDISLDRITAENTAAVQLLEVCAYLAPEPVPLDLFTTHADLLPEPLSSAAADPLAFTEAIAVLVDYSLAKRTAAGLQLHRLVQATIRARHAHPLPPHPRETLPDGLMRGRGHAIRWRWRWGCCAPMRPAQIMGAPQEWPRWAVLLPHVLAATAHLDHASNSRARRCGGCRVAAGPGGNLPAGARPAHRCPAAARTGPGHRRGRPRARPPRRRHRLNNLALILRDLGQPAAARPLQERALAIDEAAYGPDHPDVATDLNNLALILQDLGQPGEARPLQERALAIDEAAYGPDHPDVATDLNNLAMILQDLGQPLGARPLLERALAIDEAAYGPDHPTVAIRLNNLAMILQDLGEPPARPLHERALAIDEAAYGPDHPAVATDLNNLAMILRDLGQPGRPGRCRNAPWPSTRPPTDPTTPTSPPT